MEVMVAVTLVAILAAVAVPQYRNVVEQGHWNAARDILITIYAGESTYRSANPTYINPPNPPYTWLDIYLDDPNPPPPNAEVQFFISSSGPSTFVAAAQRLHGPCSGRCMTIDQRGQVNFNQQPLPAGCSATRWAPPPC